MFVLVLILLGVVIAIGIPLWAIIDAARRPTISFHQIGSDKTRWIVILVVLSVFFNLGGVVASIVYLASARPRLQKASSMPLETGVEPSALRKGEGSIMLASDEDRERVTHELRHHFEAGRLTHDDLNGRLDATLRARTVGELFEVVQDLPQISEWSGASIGAGHALTAGAMKRGHPFATQLMRHRTTICLAVPHSERALHA